MRSVPVLRGAVSPFGLAAYATVLFLLSWVFPPGTYSRVMHEQDLLFLEPTTLVFFLLCVGFFTLGFWIVCPKAVPFCMPQLKTRMPSALFLIGPVLIGLLLVARGFLQLLHENPSLLALILNQQAQELKGTDVDKNVDQLSKAAPGLIALIWWSMWRYWELRPRGGISYVFRALLLGSVVAAVASSIVLVSRNLIMEMFAGMTILYVLHREADGKMSWRFVGTMAAVLVFGVAGLFGLFSFLRGSASLDAQLYMLMGYSTASYNRLAALVIGKLHYPYAGRGLYLSTFISLNDQLHKLIPLDKIFRWPPFFTEWSSEFGAVERTGLNGSMIFLGAFGFIFCDLGWFSPFWLLGYGLVYGYLWRAMRRSSVAGILIYPFAGFCVLFWFGTNLFLDSSIIPFIRYAVLLFVYELLFLKRGVPSIRALTTKIIPQDKQIILPSSGLQV